MIAEKIFILFLVLVLCVCLACNITKAGVNDFVLVGGVTVSDGKIKLDDEWFQETDASLSDADDKKRIQVSISNCAGYLATANMKYVGSFKWESSIMPDSVAPDAVEKIRACKESPTVSYDMGTAFAVISSGNDYKNYKLESPDLRKIFASLPGDIRSWANCSRSEVPEDCVRKEKDILSLNVGDNWADTDGNGEIDLVRIKGNCSNTGDYVCGKTLILDGWRWKQIASSKPA